MISKDELDKSILELESHDTTYATCERLAWLYICRDHQTKSGKAVTTEGSDFLSACAGKNADDVLQIIDSHMDMVAVLYPKEYESVIMQIQKLTPA